MLICSAWYHRIFHWIVLEWTNLSSQIGLHFLPENHPNLAGVHPEGLDVALILVPLPGVPHLIGRLDRLSLIVHKVLQGVLLHQKDLSSHFLRGLEKLQEVLLLWGNQKVPGLEELHRVPQLRVVLEILHGVLLRQGSPDKEVPHPQRDLDVQCLDVLEVLHGLICQGVLLLQENRKSQCLTVQAVGELHLLVKCEIILYWNFRTALW